MLFSSILFVLSFAGLAVAHNASLSALQKAFHDANIPESMSLTFDPKVLLEVTFPQLSGEAITLDAGAELPRNATVGPPLFGVVGNGSPGPFVVALIDPDTPTPQDRRIAQVRHYLGGNFVFANADSKHSPRLTNTTPAVTEFVQPRPRAGSDPHRYVFLLFEQSAAFNNQTWVTHTTPASFFNISTFAAAVGLGQPIGGTYMMVGPDPSTA